MVQSRSLWTQASSDLILKSDEVHIWNVDIEKNTADLEFYRILLSAEEREQADRFYFEQDRIRHAVTHGVLRMLISGYINKKPDEILFKQGKFKKPGLSIESENTLCFNLSHSGNYIVYAFSWNNDLGIDIEKFRIMEDADSIIERFCSDREKVEYFSIPEEARMQAFFDCWTRKEAYIKARGDGLYFPLNHFSVSINNDACLIEVKDEPLEPERWKFHNITVHNNYSGALVYAKEKKNLCFFQWTKMPEP